MSEYEAKLFKRLAEAEAEIKEKDEGIKCLNQIKQDMTYAIKDLQAKLDDTEGYLFDATELIQEAYEQYMEIICYGTTDASLSTQPFRRFLDKMEKRNEGK